MAGIESFPECDTPAFVYDLRSVVASAERICEVAHAWDCRCLYSLKACALTPILDRLSGLVDGFAVSSLFEARMAAERLDGTGTIHITSPGIRRAEISEIVSLCDYVSFNSVEQWFRLRDFAGGTFSGLRINPQMSFVEDKRYDPSREHSKLGIPLERLSARCSHDRSLWFEGISGLHVHNNADSSDLRELLATVRRIRGGLERIIATLDWINIGGGYLYDDPSSYASFGQAITELRGKRVLEVYIEPGAAIVRDAGVLVSAVLDVFDSEGKMIAVLDTTVNHAPEVFEYGWQPEVRGASGSGRYSYILAGCTCVAGDVFGEYAFDAPLEVGSRVVFEEMGAYTLVKAHTFNGVDLPTVYVKDEHGDIVLRKQFGFDEFASKCGVKHGALV